MTTYLRKKESHDPDFFGRTIGVGVPGDMDIIKVPDTEVLCNGCNGNVFPDPVFEVFFSKTDLKMNRPYDVYCEGCAKRMFPKAEIIA